MDSEEKLGGQSLVEECKTIVQLCGKLRDASSDADNSLNCEKLAELLDRYKEENSLLDPYLAGLCSAVPAYALRSGVARSSPAYHAFYTLCKVRGYKTVSKLLPHDVDVFEEVATAFLSSEDGPEFWERRFCLLVWLGTLALVPFDLAVLESYQGLVESLVQRAKVVLGEGGRPSEGAAFFLSRLLGRKDMCGRTQDTLNWSLEEGDSVNRTYLLSKLLKHGSREEIRQAVDAKLERVLHICENTEGRNTMERQGLVKLVQRTALLYLPPQVADWRYKRGSRILFSSKSTCEGRKGSRGLHKTGEAPDAAEVSFWAQLDDRHVLFFERVIDLLLRTLPDRDTSVRWSSAKGIGRITGRLPKVLAVEVCEAVLSAVLDADADEFIWHGSCLALAELARRGLMLPEDGTLAGLVRVAARGGKFDLRRGTASVGGQVRDAACYVCWALARAYAPADLSPYGRDLASLLVPIALFDREVTCRRAASAALQECIGRLGSEVVPHGLELLPHLDFYVVSDRKRCFLEIAAEVCRLGLDHFYQPHILDDLLSKRLTHWDECVRSLAASSLEQVVALLGKQDQDYVVATLAGKLLASGDVAEQHGLLLGLSRCCQFLAGEEAVLSAVQSFVLNGDEARKHTKSGQLILCANNELVAEFASNCCIQPPHLDSRFAGIALRSLGSSTSSVRAAAARAVQKLGSISPEGRRWLAERIIPRISEDGFALAAAGLPCTELISPTVENLTCAASPEARRNLTAVLGALTAEGLVSGSTAMRSLLICGEDYQVDPRGDVGSWVREGAMTVIPRVIQTCNDRNLIVAAIGVCLRQLFERINRTREVAFSALHEILKREGEFLELAEVFGRLEDASSSSVFGSVPEFLKLTEFRGCVVIGLAFSVGGVGDVADLAADAVCSHLSVEELLCAYLKNRHHQRLSLPLLTSMQTVLLRTPHDDATWQLELANEVCKDLRGARDMKRVSTTIRILEELLNSAVAEERCKRALINLLCHPIPRARRLAAEALYTYTLIVDGPDELGDTLSNTSWETGKAVDLAPTKERVSLLFNT
mmetsp:Transcript_12069/g.36780  ORF Transcript_12069/g.36780 Transcript_12069/m.36780 type:complete len:1053 (-) Transcript_12069:2361-5519(-)|eukprot:CAMPEP_0198726234 /NCGR_PEP_ID=MMETSP1475-20131203/3353_1 /TAXON_ID= ORGANISM="Unidentified sp., Strain CCMP1999" /NCGR_SAMPLE_ID=MMETSP1475 /ASSEMBLY_ACC=CAM_ASM_001111 /LENGTH=1052 /DNA_ID=CAMNT_0044488137 /DNA_START=190 /DNA_END=3348 /DNA_ORIENTATION=-